MAQFLFGYYKKSASIRQDRLVRIVFLKAWFLRVNVAVFMEFKRSGLVKNFPMRYLSVLISFIKSLKTK
jgi:hypothetical protein